MIFSFPAVRNSADRADINRADNATHHGDDVPKNSAISRPDENPAPIDVPMNKNATLKAVNI